MGPAVKEGSDCTAGLLNCTIYGDLRERPQETSACSTTRQTRHLWAQTGFCPCISLIVYTVRAYYIKYLILIGQPQYLTVKYLY